MEEHEKLIGINTKLTNDVNKLTKEKAISNLYLKKIFFVIFYENFTVEKKLKKIVDENKELLNKAEIEITKLQNGIRI